jgi:ABC-type nitrate/sulfonate/bicarbonate transport system ATPase subunit
MSERAASVEPSLALDNIVQEFPSPDGHSAPVRVIDDVSMRFDGAGINMLLGPSGCGKSTMLRMMGGVRPFGITSPTSGRVQIDGQLCHEAHDDAVMVFQQYVNRPDLSVYDNVASPFRFKLWRNRLSASEIAQRVNETLLTVGLEDKAKLRPAQLSGGQRQRVALARALVLRPRILLMDEPFGALDAQTREDMQQLLLQLWEQLRSLVVFVTHDVTEALLLGDRVIVLSTRPARIADDFTIAEARPRSAAWRRSTEALKMEERVLARLHEGPTRGHVRMTV